MTRSIAALERAVGVRLFDRGPNGVEPTAFGNILLERGARVLAGEADLRREIQLLAGLDVGRLAVSAAPFPFEISVGAAVARLIAAHPGLKVRALLADPREVVRDVLARNADVGLVDAQFVRGQTDLVAESMPRHDFVMAGRPSHPLVGRAGLRLAEVLAFPMASTLIVNEVVTAAVSERGRLGPSGRRSWRIDPGDPCELLCPGATDRVRHRRAGSRYRADAGAGTERGTVGAP